MESHGEVSPKELPTLNRRELLKGAAALGAAAVLEKVVKPFEAQASPDVTQTNEKPQAVEGLNGETLDEKKERDSR